MAEHQAPTYSTKPITDKQKAKEFEEHTRTYSGFLWLTKWSVIVTCAILILLYLVFVH